MAVHSRFSDLLLESESAVFEKDSLKGNIGLAAVKDFFRYALLLKYPTEFEIVGGRIVIYSDLKLHSWLSGKINNLPEKIDSVDVHYSYRGNNKIIVEEQSDFLKNQLKKRDSWFDIRTDPLTIFTSELNSYVFLLTTPEVKDFYDGSRKKFPLSVNKFSILKKSSEYVSLYRTVPLDFFSGYYYLLKKWNRNI